MSARRPTGFVRPTVGPPPPPPRLGPGAIGSSYSSGGAAASSATGGSSAGTSAGPGRAARKSRTEAAIFDAFSDPRGVTTVALSGEISTRAPALRPSLRSAAGSSGHHGAADRARSASPSQAPVDAKRSSRVGGVTDGPHPVVYPLSVPKGVKGPSGTLRSALAQLTAASSSAAYMESHCASMAGLSRKARKAGTLRRRADDARIQQLRGIFAGHDANRDGFLSEEDLVAALLGLGIEPTAHVLAAFAAAAKNAATARSRADRIARLSQAEGMDAEAAAEVVAMQDRAAAAAAAAAAGRSSLGLHGTPTPVGPGALVALEDVTASGAGASARLSKAGGDSFIEVDLATFVRVIMSDLPDLSLSTPGALESTAPHTEDLMLAYDAGLAAGGAAPGTAGAPAAASGGSGGDATSSVSAGQGQSGRASIAALGEDASRREPSGTVPLSALLHVLCEVEGPAALGVEEVTDLLTMTGILSELQARSPDTLYATQVDYGALLRLIQFPLPQPKRAAAGAAAATVVAAAAAGGDAAGTAAPSASASASAPGKDSLPPPPPPPPTSAMRRGGASTQGTPAGSKSAGGSSSASTAASAAASGTRPSSHYAFVGAGTGAGSGRDATSPVKDVRGAPAMPAAAARPSALKGGRLASVTGSAGAGAGAGISIGISMAAAPAASSPLGPAAGVDRSPAPAHAAGAYSRASAAAAAAASVGRSQGRFSDRLASALEAEADVSESSRALNRAAAAGLRVRF